MRKRRILPVLLLALLLTPLVPAEGDGATLLGRWTLSEQYYEDGRHDFHEGDDALTVTFRKEGNALAGTVSWGAHTVRWPAYPTPRGPAVLESQQVEAAADLRTATARLRVAPPEGDDTVLLVEERWELGEDGRLVCTVAIRFERQGEERGGFRWTRIFEREGRR